MKISTLMLREAAETPDKVAAQQRDNRAAAARIAATLRARAPKFIATCARGSSDHAATYAKYLAEIRLGLATCSFAPSVASVYGASVSLKDALFLCISQSGRSPDLLQAADTARRQGAYVVAVVNDEDSPLAAIAEDVLPIGAGPEKSVAATKSCIGAMAAIFDLYAQWSESAAMASALDALPASLAEAFECDWSHALPAMEHTRQALIISRGIGLAAAQEAALKLKETCRIQAEPFSAAEVRHGPMAIVDEGFPIIAASTFDAAQDSIDDVSRHFAERGAKMFMAGSPVGAPVEKTASLPAPRASLTDLQPLIFLMAFYRFANDLALLRNLDPDKPDHLQKVTETV